MKICIWIMICTSFCCCKNIPNKKNVTVNPKNDSSTLHCYFNLCLPYPMQLLDSTNMFDSFSQTLDNDEEMFYVFDKMNNKDSDIFKAINMQTVTKLPMKDRHIYMIEKFLKSTDKGFFKNISYSKPWLERFIIYNESKGLIIIFQEGNHVFNM